MFPFSSDTTKPGFNPAILLQYNATIIVGLFLFLTFSEGLFTPGLIFPTSYVPNFGPGLENSTIELARLNQKLIESGQFLQLFFTSIMLIPFSISSIIIIYIQVFEVKPEKKPGLVALAGMLSMIGTVFVVTFMFVLLIIRPFS